MISQYQALASAIARGWLRKLPHHVAREDVEQAALIGLWKAVSRHPEGGGPAYTYYLRQRINGAIVDELRTIDWSTRRQRSSGKTSTPIHYEQADELDALLREFGPANDLSPEDAAIRNSDLRAAFSAPLHPTDALIIDECFVRGRTMRDVGAELGISEARVSQRATRAIGQMRERVAG